MLSRPKSGADSRREKRDIPGSQQIEPGVFFIDAIRSSYHYRGSCGPHGPPSGQRCDSHRPDGPQRQRPGRPPAGCGAGPEHYRDRLCAGVRRPAGGGDPLQQFPPSGETPAAGGLLCPPGSGTDCRPGAGPVHRRQGRQPQGRHPASGSAADPGLCRQPGQSDGHRRDHPGSRRPSRMRARRRRAWWPK